MCTVSERIVDWLVMLHCTYVNLAHVLDAFSYDLVNCGPASLAVL